MSNLLYSYFLEKTNHNIISPIGEGEDDPYFEVIPENELHFYQKKGAKRKRKLPQFIPHDDLKVLDSVKRKSYRLDLQLSCCGYRFGWAGVIGLMPWIGDCISLALALDVLNKAKEIQGGLPKLLESRMLANILLDFGIGLIPFLGDIVNIMYKCNSRNFILLEKHLVEEYSKERPPEHTVDQAHNKSNSKNHPHQISV